MDFLERNETIYIQRALALHEFCDEKKRVRGHRTVLELWDHTRYEKTRKNHNAVRNRTNYNILNTNFLVPKPKPPWNESLLREIVLAKDPQVYFKQVDICH